MLQPMNAQLAQVLSGNNRIAGAGLGGSGGSSSTRADERFLRPLAGNADPNLLFSTKGSAGVATGGAGATSTGSGNGGGGAGSGQTLIGTKSMAQLGADLLNNNLAGGNGNGGGTYD